MRSDAMRFCKVGKKCHLSSLLENGAQPTSNWNPYRIRICCRNLNPRKSMCCHVGATCTNQMMTRIQFAKRTTHLYDLHDNNAIKRNIMQWTIWRICGHDGSNMCWTSRGAGIHIHIAASPAAHMWYQLQRQYNNNDTIVYTIYDTIYDDASTRASDKQICMLGNQLYCTQATAASRRDSYSCYHIVDTGTPAGFLIHLYYNDKTNCSHGVRK
jgi:hypothetical protein